LKKIAVEDVPAQAKKKLTDGDSNNPTLEGKEAKPPA
jgi:hypothetical protein